MYIHITHFLGGACQLCFAALCRPQIKAASDWPGMAWHFYPIHLIHDKTGLWSFITVRIPNVSGGAAFGGACWYRHIWNQAFDMVCFADQCHVFRCVCARGSCNDSFILYLNEKYTCRSQQQSATPTCVYNYMNA
jgi:hypothetical protein